MSYLFRAQTLFDLDLILCLLCLVSFYRFVFPRLFFPFAFYGAPPFVRQFSFLLLFVLVLFVFVSFCFVSFVLRAPLWCINLVV